MEHPHPLVPGWLLVGGIGAFLWLAVNLGPHVPAPAAHVVYASTDYSALQTHLLARWRNDDDPDALMVESISWRPGVIHITMQPNTNDQMASDDLRFISTDASDVFATMVGGRQMTHFVAYRNGEAIAAFDYPL